MNSSRSHGCFHLLLLGVEPGPQIAAALIVENLPDAIDEPTDDKKSYHRNEEKNEGVKTGCGPFEAVHWIGWDVGRKRSNKQSVKHSNRRKGNGIKFSGRREDSGKSAFQRESCDTPNDRAV